MQGPVDEYAEWGVTPPEVTKHGSDTDLEGMRQRLPIKKWRQEGNRLIGECEIGRLVVHVPTNKILVGTDDNGLPVLTDISIS